jgi:transcriptional regulator with XRE-family HTH domain
MPQKPAKRHVIADIRIQCGLTQTELAKILGYGRPKGLAAITVQKIEQGKLELSEDLARRAEEELGVSASYLLANDPRGEPVTPRGGRWTTDLYEFAQGIRGAVTEEMPSGKRRGIMRATDTAPGAADSYVAWCTADYCAKIEAMLQATKGLPRQGILLHRLSRAMDDLLERFPPDKSTLAMHAPKLRKLKAVHDEIAMKISLEENRQFWEEAQEDRQKWEEAQGNPNPSGS